MFTALTRIATIATLACVTYEEALLHVSNPDDFALRFKGISGTSDSSWDDFDKEGKSGDGEISLTEESDDDLKIDRF